MKYNYSIMSGDIYANLTRAEFNRLVRFFETMCEERKTAHITDDKTCSGSRIIGVYYELNEKPAIYLFKRKKDE